MDAAGSGARVRGIHRIGRAYIVVFSLLFVAVPEQLPHCATVGTVVEEYAWQTICSKIIYRTTGGLLMNKMNAFFALLIALSGCASAPYKAKIADQPAGASIGIIDFMNKNLLHEHYGLLAGISHRYDAYAEPFDVGEEFAQLLSQKINANGVFKAVVIPTPPEFQSILPDVSLIGDPSHKDRAGSWIGADLIGPKVKPEFVPVFQRLAQTYNVQSFVIIRSIWEAPLHQDAMPGGFGPSVFTKSHGPLYFSYTMLGADCLAFDMNSKRLEDICQNSVNAIHMEDYRGPESGKEPLGREDEIANDLHQIVLIRAAAAAEALSPKAAR